MYWGLVPLSHGTQFAQSAQGSRIMGAIDMGEMPPSSNAVQSRQHTHGLLRSLRVVPCPLDEQ